MATEPTADNTIEATVNRYFELIQELRYGNKEAVPALMELWHPEGTFEFAGAPPVTGTFIGEMAIRAMYKNRLGAVGMDVELQIREEETQHATLGVVITDVRHLRVNGERAAASWRTTIGTEEGHGFDVGGGHVFQFEDGRIRNLRVTVSPNPEPSELETLRLDDLSISDVGRLSLAAWPVV